MCEHGAEDCSESSRDVSKLYYELLYAVTQVFPGESRHEIALRYIREAEVQSNQTGSCATEWPPMRQG
jgi:hypothetical protein